MPPAERRALLILLSLAVAGQGVRYFLTRPDDAPGQVHLLATMGPGALDAQRNQARQLARPLAAGERIDVDAASAAELARLPRVGPRLAKTIVAHRDSHGVFGSLEALDRVPGVGPGLLQTLAPLTAFGGRALSPAASPLPRVPASPLNINSASLSELDALPGIGPARARAILRYREERGPFGYVEELAQVPGLGPAAISRLQDRVSVR